jgi:MFS family permease
MRARDLVDFTPIVDGVRYVAKDRRLLATLLVKTGLGIMGTSWVIIPVLGQRHFPVPAASSNPQRAGMLGMSLLMGARGVGALLGPLIGGYWAGEKNHRLRVGILIGFLASIAGYLTLGVSGSIWFALAAVVLSHAGGSIVWVFSTTLLQEQTDDRFRGRVFSADYAFLVIAMSAVTYLAGVLIDHGVTAKTVAILTGLAGIVPTVAWALALRLWRPSTAPSVPDHGDR